MSLDLDVRTHLNLAMAEAAAVAAKNLFFRTGEDISTGFSRQLSEATRGFSLGAMRDEVTATSRLFNTAGIASVVGFTAAVGESVKAAGDFQQEMTKLSASASVPADQLKTISDGVLQLAGQVGYSASELGNAMFTISKAGYDAADGLKVLTAAAQGANAEQAQLPEVVNALTTSLHDFNVPADQAAKVMSQMVTAVGESKVPLQAFAGALHTIEPGAQAAHIALSDLWGVLAQITQSGTSADQAADQINNAIRSLSNPQTPARDAMQQLGINADEVSQKLGDGPGGRGLAGTMQYLSQTVMAHFADANRVNALAN